LDEDVLTLSYYIIFESDTYRDSTDHRPRPTHCRWSPGATATEDRDPR